MIDLRQGDCLEIMKDIPDKSIDLIVTDPPYLIQNTKAGGKSQLAKSIQNMNNELENNYLTEGIEINVLEEMVRVMKKINIYMV